MNEETRSLSRGLEKSYSFKKLVSLPKRAFFKAGKAILDSAVTKPLGTRNLIKCLFVAAAIAFSPQLIKAQDQSTNWVAEKKWRVQMLREDVKIHWDFVRKDIPVIKELSDKEGLKRKCRREQCPTSFSYRANNDFNSALVSGYYNYVDDYNRLLATFSFTEEYQYRNHHWYCVRVTTKKVKENPFSCSSNDEERTMGKIYERIDEDIRIHHMYSLLKSALPNNMREAIMNALGGVEPNFKDQQLSKDGNDMIYTGNLIFASRYGIIGFSFVAYLDTKLEIRSMKGGLFPNQERPLELAVAEAKQLNDKKQALEAFIEHHSDSVTKFKGTNCLEDDYPTPKRIIGNSAEFSLKIPYPYKKEYLNCTSYLTLRVQYDKINNKWHSPITIYEEYRQNNNILRKSDYRQNGQ